MKSNPQTPFLRNSFLSASSVKDFSIRNHDLSSFTAENRTMVSCCQGVHFVDSDLAYPSAFPCQAFLRDHS